MIKLLGLGVAAWFAALGIAGAQTPSPTAEPSQKADNDPALQGKAIYAEKCSHCHGPGMLNPGTITPDLRRFPDDRDRFVNTVKLGKNNKMPPWGDLLGDEEIASLWAYISSQRKP